MCIKVLSLIFSPWSRLCHIIIAESPSLRRRFVITYYTKRVENDAIDITMSPYPAIHRNGACTGSLWKSHSRIISNSNPLPKADEGSSPTAAAALLSLDGFLAEANERQRAHEFCVLVGNTLWSYSDVWAYAKGDPPTVSLIELFEAKDSYML